MGRSIDFRVIAFDEASREFRKVGDEALKMAAEVRAADAAMADSHAKAGLSAYRHAKAFDKAAREIENDASKVENRVKTAWGEVIKANDKLDQSLVNMWHRSNPLMKAFLFMLPMLPPLLNSAAVAAGALGSAIVSAGFGLGVLAAGLKANLSLWEKARGFADPKTGKMNWQKVPEIHQFALDTQPLAFQVFDTVLKSLQILLPRVTPIFVAFASKFIEFLHGINHDLQGPGFAQFVNWVRTVGSYNFGNILNSVKNIAVGLAHLAMDFTGQGMGLTKWLDDITAKFAHWAKVLPNTAGWKSFLDMFHQDGPLVRDIFKQLAMLVPKILGALAPLSHMTLTALDDILKFANRLKPSTIDNIVKSLVALKLAMTALSMVSKGKTFMSLIGLGGGAGGAAGEAGMLASAGPWTAAFAAAIAALAGSYTLAWHNSSRFRAEQKQMFNDMSRANNAVKQGIDKVTKYGEAHKAAASMVGKDNLMGHSFWASLMGIGARAVADMIIKLALFVHGLAQLLIAIGHIPTFGWATRAGQAMDRAAQSALNLANKIAGIHSKTVTITVRYNTFNTTVDTLIHQGRTVGTYGTARAPKYATGGRPDVGRASWVGENGPELFIPDNPGRVVSHEKSMKMAGGGNTDALAKALAKALQGIQIKLIDSDGNGRRAYLISGKTF